MEYKIGLWEKKSQKGVVYYFGKVEINGKEYKVSLFKNNKQNEKQPDYNIIMRNEEKKEENKKENNSDKIFEEFGKGIDISDEEIAF